MNKDTPILDFGREGTNDALTEILREGARKLLLAAVEDEIQHFLKENAEQRPWICNASARELRCGVKDYINTYNTIRPHQSPGGQTPDKIYRQQQKQVA